MKAFVYGLTGFSALMVTAEMAFANPIHSNLPKPRLLRQNAAVTSASPTFGVTLGIDHTAYTSQKTPAVIHIEVAFWLRFG